MSEKNRKNNKELFVFKVSFMMLLMFQKTIALHHCEVGEDSPVRAGQAKSGQFWTGTDRLELKVSLFILKNVVRSESISVWAYFHLGLAYHEYLE